MIPGLYSGPDPLYYCIAPLALNVYETPSITIVVFATMAPPFAGSR